MLRAAPDVESAFSCSLNFTDTPWAFTSICPVHAASLVSKTGAKNRN